MVSILLMLIMSLFSVGIGAKSLPMTTVLDALFHFQANQLEHIIVIERIPRTLFAIFAGIGLAISGLLMQSVTRNPISDPTILGITNGSAFFIVIGLVYFHITAAYQYIFLSLLGALVAFVCVFSLTLMASKQLTGTKLALAGSAVGILFVSFTQAIMLPDSHAMETFRFWQVGSVAGIQFQHVYLVMLFVTICFILCLILRHPLNGLQLNDELAKSLGMHIVKIRLFASIIAIVLSAIITAFGGPIGFIGLIVPHMIKSKVKPDIAYQLPLVSIIGANLLLVSDIAGRLLGYPGEIEVGILLAIIGVPLFIYMLKKGKTFS